MGCEGKQDYIQQIRSLCKKMIRSCTARRCKTCNIGFYKESCRRKHYESSGWHDYNRNRNKAGAPPVKEADFLATPSPVLYVCRPCGKGFRCSKAHVQHLESRDHAERVAPPDSDSDFDFDDLVF